jgi:hypothetical protein
MRDLASKLAHVVVIAPATYAADTTPAAIDLQGYDSAAIALAIGVGGITFDGTNKIEFVLTHADDDGTGNPGAFANVAAADINGAGAPAVVTNGIVKSLVAAHAAADVTEIGYIGGKRYVKLLADFSGTHGTGTPISAIMAKGHPRNAPAA